MSPEEISKRKYNNIHTCCDFKIKTMAWVTIVEGFQHYSLGRSGSTLQRMFYPFALCLVILAIKHLLKRKRWLEDHAAFMLSASLILILTECSIFLSPTVFNITPV
jgi:hypothetical protein